jgi:hypothetical protein
LCLPWDPARECMPWFLRPVASSGRHTAQQFCRPDCSCADGKKISVCSKGEILGRKITPPDRDAIAVDDYDT